MRSSAELDRAIVKSSAWNALGSGGTQLVTFGVMILLARLLTPHAFGLVALASLPLLAFAYLQESGLSAAVIRYRGDVERAAATQLVFSTLVSLALYAVAFAGAPLLAHFFSQPALTGVFRVLAIGVVLRGLSQVPGAILERELAFDKRARGDVAGVLVQAALSVSLAFAGAGVWSLVAGQLANLAVVSLVYWIVAPLRPSPRRASWQLLRELGSFGRHVAVNNVVLLVQDNADNVVIGRLLNAAAVGVYQLAWRLANLPAIEIGIIFGRASFAAYSSVRDDLSEFRRIFLVTVTRVSFLSMPVAAGIAVAAEPLILGVFGERWRAAVVPLRILAILGWSRTLSGLTAPVFQAAGRPQVNYQIGVFHLVVLAALLALLARPYGVEGVAWADAGASVASMIPCYVVALRILEVPLSDVLQSIGRPAGAAAAVAVALLVVRAALSGMSAGPQLIVLLVTGVAVFSLTMITFGRDELRTIVGAFRTSAAPS